jgi:hypothetical protein
MPNQDANQFCDVVQGFNLRKDAQAKVGFLTKLRVGKQTFDADFACKDPENNQSDKKVVAVLSHLQWSTSPTDPVKMRGYLSDDARKKLVTLLMTDMSDLSVDYQFDVYTYDYDEKKYYKCLTSKDTDMNGLLFKEGGGALSCSVQEEPNMSVQQPRNYLMDITVKPEAKQQAIHYSTSVSGKLVLNWGLTQS